MFHVLKFRKKIESVNLIKFRLVVYKFLSNDHEENNKTASKLDRLVKIVVQQANRHAKDPYRNNVR